MENTLDVAVFWSDCLARLETELPYQQFSTWIRPLQVDLTQRDGGFICLIAPNRFVLQWVRDRYLSRVQVFADNYFGQAVEIKMVVVTAVSPTSETSLPSVSRTPQMMVPPAVISHAVMPSLRSVGSPPLLKNKNLLWEDTTPSIPLFSSRAPMPSGNLSSSANDKSHLQVVYERTNLNKNLTFTELVRGKTNDLAHAAAKQVSLSPGGSYNPLFIYGRVGLGKTHALQAIGNEAFLSDSNRAIRYIHANDYYADVVKAYQQGSFETFTRYYRSLDILLIDDIQFFNNKARTQEEFFHVFNALIEEKKQIVITCDTYPRDITGLSDRLISRFDWGLTVAIEAPDTEMRVAILRKKAEVESVILDEGVAFFIAKHLKANVRELEGALNKVLAYSRFHGRDITLEVARDALRDILNAYNRQVTIETIQKTVADYYKIKVIELFSKKRTVNFTRPRQMAMALARELTSASLPSIGEAFGGRDHTTVLYACRHIAELRSKDSQVEHDMHILIQTLKN